MTVAISMVTFSSEPAFSSAELQQFLTSKWPEVPTPSDVEEKDGTLMFQVGNDLVIYATMPAPIPWSDLEGPCSTSIMWPDAEKDLKQHKFHVIVTVNSESEPVEVMTLLTQATAALMATSESSQGVLWGNAMLLVRKDVFIDFATDVMPEELPLHIWIDFRVGQDGPRSSGGFTTGMTALGHMEFEAKQTPEPPSELRDRFMGLAGYVLENGPVINDGDTIGQDVNERIRVVYSDSEFGHEGQVMRLVYEQESSAKPWWKFW